jgi:hypothetical protein
MPNLTNWLRPNTAQTLAFDPSRIIERDMVELTLARGTTDLDPQYVRVVPVSEGSQQGQTAGTNVASQAGVVVIGNDDLDIQKGDLFTFRSTRYKVIYVNSAIPGMIQARAEGTQ